MLLAYYNALRKLFVYFFAVILEYRKKSTKALTERLKLVEIIEHMRCCSCEVLRTDSSKKLKFVVNAEE